MSQFKGSQGGHEEFPQREGQPIPSSFCSGRTAEAHPGKESAHHVGDPGPIPELGRSPGEGNGNPLQYSQGTLVGYIQFMGSQKSQIQLSS